MAPEERNDFLNGSKGWKLHLAYKMKGTFAMRFIGKVGVGNVRMCHMGLSMYLLWSSVVQQELKVGLFSNFPIVAPMPQL